MAGDGVACYTTLQLLRRILFTITHPDTHSHRSTSTYTHWYGLTRNVKYRAYLFTGLFGFTYSLSSYKTLHFWSSFSTSHTIFGHNFCVAFISHFATAFFGFSCFPCHLSLTSLILTCPFCCWFLLWLFHETHHPFKRIVSCPPEARPQVAERRKWEWERQLEWRCLIRHQRMAQRGTIVRMWNREWEKVYRHGNENLCAQRQSQERKKTTEYKRSWIRKTNLPKNKIDM